MPEVTLNIGALPILVSTRSVEFLRLLEARYENFVSGNHTPAQFQLDVDLAPDGTINPDEDVRVRHEGERWTIERGDFRAEWDPLRRQGWVRQTLNPYSIDSVLRILHTLLLAPRGGFLVHAASAVRNGRGFIFAGVSGAGKTTLMRLAPPDVALLSDEVSYVKPKGELPSAKSEIRSRKSEFQIVDSEPPIPTPDSPAPVFEAFGTPFIGELGRIGRKLRAPLASLFLLKQGRENRIEPLSKSEAVRELLRHVLFFAQDEELVCMIFQTVLNFVTHVPVHRLVFTPDARVWELIA